MARLGINIKQVAAMRQTGHSGDPDPVTAAMYAELGGADGIVCPVRDDFQPVTERDVRLLKELVKTHLTLQIPPTEKMISLALATAPDMVTLVPGKKPGTTEGGGLDVLGRSAELGKVVQGLRSKGMIVSLLVDPNVHQVKAAARLGADYVELHMGQYVMAEDLNDRADQLENIGSVALAAEKMDLGVSAGQGLGFQSVAEISTIPSIEEINVGRAVISRSLWIGMEQAVRDMAALVK